MPFSFLLPRLSLTNFLNLYQINGIDFECIKVRKRNDIQKEDESVQQEQEAPNRRCANGKMNEA